MLSVGGVLNAGAVLGGPAIQSSSVGALTLTVEWKVPVMPMCNMTQVDSLVAILV